MFKLTIYLPNRDKNGDYIPHESYSMTEATIMESLTDMYGGVTYTKAQGSYKTKGGSVIVEDTGLISVLMDNAERAEAFMPTWAANIKDELNQETVLYTIEKLEARFI